MNKPNMVVLKELVLKPIEETISKIINSESYTQLHWHVYHLHHQFDELLGLLHISEHDMQTAKLKHDSSIVEMLIKLKGEK